MCIMNHALMISHGQVMLALDVLYAKDRSESWHIIHILDIQLLISQGVAVVQPGQVTKTLDSHTTVWKPLVLPDPLRLLQR
jgi:hypothetical protein